MAPDDASPAHPSPLDTDEIPVAVPPAATRRVASRTWALGTIAVIVAAGQALTGLGLLFFYRPGMTSAYLDLVDLAATSPFAYLRELHLWGSHALLIAVALHLFRVVATAAYRPPRRVNHHLGIALGALVTLLAVTGYLLPWDRHAQWLLGVLAAVGVEADDALLTGAHALHVGVLPVAAGLLIFHHLRRARRDDARDPSRK